MPAGRVSSAASAGALARARGAGAPPPSLALVAVRRALPGRRRRSPAREPGGSCAAARPSPAGRSASCSRFAAWAGTLVFVGSAARRVLRQLPGGPPDVLLGPGRGRSTCRGNRRRRAAGSGSRSRDRARRCSRSRPRRSSRRFGRRPAHPGGHRGDPLRLLALHRPARARSSAVRAAWTSGRSARCSRCGSGRRPHSSGICWAP